MAKFLIKASYSSQGVRGVMKEGGTSRRDTVGALTSNLGGTMESFYFGFGEADAYVTVDLPDNISAAAIALAVNATGAVQVSTVVLMTPEEIDEAAKKTVDYRPPGG
jgi:uncharacterized protein with GYD domain